MNEYPSATIVKTWTVDETARWLVEVGYGDYTAAFLEREISGSRLLELKEFQLRNYFGCNKRVQSDFWSTLERIRQNTTVKTKISPAGSAPAMYNYHSQQRGGFNRPPQPMPPPSHGLPTMHGHRSYNPPGYNSSHTPLSHVNQTSYYESDDSFDDSDDDKGWNDHPSTYTSMKPTDRPAPVLPFSRLPPAVPRKDDDEDTYLPIDPVMNPQEIGVGFFQPPRAQPRQDISRAPYPAPQGIGTRGVPPPRPPKDLPLPNNDVYEPVAENGPPMDTGMPSRPAPTPPGHTPSPSPKSSFINRHGSSGRSNDSGLGNISPRSSSRNGSTNINTSHSPRRVGSQGSTSSGEHTDNELPSPRHLHFPAKQPTLGNNFAAPTASKLNKPMPSMGIIPHTKPNDDDSKSTVADLASKFTFALPGHSRQKRPSDGNVSTTGRPVSGFDMMPAKGHTRERPSPRIPPSGYMPPIIPSESTSSTAHQTRIDPRSETVEQQRWFAEVTREVAQTRITSIRAEGRFLVRPGRNRDTPYSLTVWAKGKFLNLQIRLRSDSQYALGTKKANERTFPSVNNMIEYYMSSPLQLAEGEGHVILTGPP